MLSAPFKRVVWKETREIFPLWLMVTLGTIALQGLLLWLARSPHDLNASGYYVASIALWLTATYALSTVGVMFAGEKEQETIDFLRRIPVSSSLVLRAKLCAGFCSSLLMLMVLVPVTLLWLMLSGTGEDVLGSDLPQHVQSGLLWIQMLVWGAVCSMLTGRVLWSMVLGGALAGLSNTFYPYNLPLLLVVLLVISGISRKWFLDRPMVEWSWPRLGWETPKLCISVPGFLDESGSTSWRTTGRLLWLETKRAKGLFWFVLLCGLVGYVLLLSFGFDLDPNRVHIFRFVCGLCSFASTSVAMIAGILAYSPEQRGNQYRFLGERGISPSRIYAIKFLVWSSVGLLLPAVVSGVTLWCISTPGANLKISRVDELLGLLVWFVSSWEVFSVILAFCVGQFCALVIPSLVVACVATILLSILLYLWSYLVLILVLPLGYFLFPIPLFLLLATWLRIGDWLNERNQCRNWIKTLLPLCLLTVVLTGSVPPYRAYEFPLIAAPEAFKTREDQEQGDTTDRALRESIQSELSMMQWGEKADPELPFSFQSGNPYGVRMAPISTAERGWEFASEAEKQWLERNIAWLLKKEPEGEKHIPQHRFLPIIPGETRLIPLMYLHHLAGSRLTSEGDIAGAFRHHLQGVRIARLCGIEMGQSNEVIYPGQVHNRLAQSEGMLSWSLNWIQQWSLSPQQTRDVLLQGMQTLEVELQQFLKPADFVEILTEESRRWEEMVEREDASLSGFFNNPPWERERMRRIQRIVTQVQLQWTGRIEGENSAVSHSASAALTQLDPAVMSGIESQVWKYVGDNPAVYLFQQQPGSWRSRWPGAMHFAAWQPEYQLSFGGNLVWLWQYRMAAQRMVLTSMALQAYRLEHGKFPATLQELVGPYLKEMPVYRIGAAGHDSQFLYYPEGLSKGLALYYLPQRAPNGSVVPPKWAKVSAGVPFLLATAVQNVSIVHRKAGELELFRLEPLQAVPRYLENLNRANPGVYFVPLHKTEALPLEWGSGPMP